MAALVNELINQETALLIWDRNTGAFTTMSTFSVETVELWSENEFHAIGYVLLTMIVCPALAFAGWRIGEIIS